MEIKHTKGKFNDGYKGWKAVEPEVKIGFATHEIHWSDDGECIAEVVHGEDNAKLIAAAPELLESLMSLKERLNYLISTGRVDINKTETMRDINIANDAIKKATE